MPELKGCPFCIRAVFGKIADKKLMALGFEKIEDSEYSVDYERYNEEFEYTHKLVILHKAHGPAIIQSYDPALFDSKNIGCTCVGLTVKEAVAASMKIISKGWNRRVSDG